MAAAALFTLVVAISIGSPALADEPATKHAPLSLAPANPHYFLFRGKPAILIGSGEHYGSVMNLDFDYVRYLDALAADGLDHTRLFTGTYHEPAGAFGIVENTLAPKPDRYLSPWKRSGVAGARDGGNKWDLKQFEPAYFTRLHVFLAAASKRGIVVEVNLFSPNYDDSIWNIHPLNAANNVNGVGAVAANETYTLKHRDLLDVEEAVTRKIVSACGEFDNLYFEVCNEPYFGGVTTDWQNRIVEVIRDSEKSLPAPHLISMNYANGSQKIDHPNPQVSIYNFHDCAPPDAVGQNHELKCVIGENETGFKGSGDDYYRGEAWDFILAGGGLFDNLDYSFTVAHPDGTAVGYKAPGGGSVALRRQLRTLHRFIENFDFVHMRPDNLLVHSELPKDTTVRALAEPGKQYAIYFRGGRQLDLQLAIPSGRYQASWLNPATGETVAKSLLDTRGKLAAIQSPPYDHEIALSLKRAD